MGKADDLLKSMGGAILESASHRGAPAAMPSAPAAASGTDRLAGLARSKAAFEIPLARIIPDPDQPREEFVPDALERLAGSIRARGILQPIRVRWDQGRGLYVIIAGERRWRATTMAGLSSIPCVVHEGATTPGELLAMQVVENALREDLKPVEQARAFKALMDLNGWSGNQLSKELGVAQSGVVDALKLIRLPGPIQERIDRGEIPASTGAKLAMLDDAAEQVALAERIVGEGMNRAEATRAVRSKAGAAGKSRGATRGRKATDRTFRVAGGKVTVENRKGADAGWIRAALSEVLAKLDQEADGRAEAAA